MRLTLGPVEVLHRDGRISASSGDRRVVVFEIDGELYALDASCAHQGGPLEQGVVKDGVVTCPWHLHRYDVSTGARTDQPSVRQEVYEVAIEDGEVVVDLPEAPPPKSMREILLEHAREWDRDQ